ncbi:hypothetical protein HK405_002854 [Cladochytrium tenue]|nr:hypothetical protein HK405_002854 [Cladochytrium tenue]
MTASASVAAARVALIGGHLAGRSDTAALSNTSSSSNVGGVGGAPPRPSSLPPASRVELNPAAAFLKRAAVLYPDRPAAVYQHRAAGASDESQSWECDYRQFSTRCRSLASALLRTAGPKTTGVTGNPSLNGRVVVGCLLFNTPAFLDCNFGVPLAGAVLVSVNTRLKQTEVEYILKKARVNVLIVDRELLPLVANVKLEPLPSSGGTSDTGLLRASSKNLPTLARAIIVDDHPGNPARDSYERFLVTAGADPLTFEQLPKLADEEDVIAINFTSGTTGMPKGVMYHYRGAYLNSLSILIEIGLTPTSRYLWTLPMFHASGWCFPWAVTAAGAAHALLRKIDYGEIWLHLSGGATHYCAAPTVQTFITAHPSARQLPRVVRTMVAAAPPSPTLLEAMLALNIEPVHVYGLTETYGPSAVCAPQEAWAGLPSHERARLLARQGQAFLTAEEVRVVDPTSLRDVPSDGEHLGEVIFSGNVVMKGYLDEPAATDAALGHGFFRTGDLAVRHPDGYIELRDRMKDIIISGGENISTIEVENELASHPLVLEACVVSTPDETWGERPVAYVTLRESGGGDAADAAGVLRAYLRPRLAGFKMPVRIEVVAELPKTSTGKVQKYVLRDREWKKAGRDGGKRIN